MALKICDNDDDLTQLQSKIRGCRPWKSDIISFGHFRYSHMLLLLLLLRRGVQISNTTSIPESQHFGGDGENGDEEMPMMTVIIMMSNTSGK